MEGVFALSGEQRVGAGFRHLYDHICIVVGFAAGPWTRERYPWKRVCDANGPAKSSIHATGKISRLVDIY